MVHKCVLGVLCAKLLFLSLLINPEKQKTGARKYSATPVSKPNRVVQKQVEYHACRLPVQNSSHPPPLHQINCGASLKEFKSFNTK
jgi:hypothetical protein